MLTKEMRKALEADGEKLRQQTGKDHGPIFIEGWLTDMAEAGWRTDPETGKVFNINDKV